MNEIAIGKANVSIKEHKRQRVITFKDIDTVHSRPDGTARRNFNRNKEHFIEGEDYFVRNSYEAKNEYSIIAPNGLVVFTESGYLMLAKSFTDNLAWEVQRALVKSYFRAKEQTSEQPQLDENPYEYADKFYKGKLVLTSIDIEHFSGINRTNIGHALRTKCEEHTDYKLLKGAELAEFKRNNPNFTRSVSCIFIVFKSGFDKLTEFFDISSIVKEIKYEYIDIENDPNFKAEIAEVRNTLNTLSTLVSEFENNAQMEKSSFKSLSHTIRDFAFYHTHSLMSMGTKDYVTITEYRK